MQDEALQLILEMNRWTWDQFKDALDDMTPEEVDWQPLPQANSINVIVRHLRIEAEWHVASLEHGEPMPVQVTDSVQQLVNSVSLDFNRNLNELEGLYLRFITALQNTTLLALRLHTALAYQDFPGEHPTHFLSFHQAVHLAGHRGQICAIRNLFRKTRGEAARFFPDNPTFHKV